ncbi:hypothetical protein [Campylobacter sp.]|uniref:hypothetical protein n=1 Tax=Campylobacter sp. TaxID=205 RepID=UPI002A839109|nr:hypothetical protein [Campylobacter sp.]MDY4802969.1 hypothetical protein [Campylobacter sp.]
MLVTQNNNFTSWNSSFSKQKQANSRETFNLEFPAEIKIQSDIKTAKKLEINGIEYLEFPSSNVEINSAVNSSVSSATSVSPAIAVNSALSQTTAVSQTTATTAYGYSVDSKGFMGADFNAAAGISENVKIHSKTIEQLTTHAKNIGFNGSVVEITKKAWSNFSQIIGDESALRGDKSYNEIKMPYSWTSNGTLLGEIRSVQRDLQSFNNASEYENSLYALNAIQSRETGSFSGFTSVFIFNIDYESGTLSNNETSRHIYNVVLGYDDENSVLEGDMGIGEAFAIWVGGGFEIDSRQSVALGDEYRASGKSLKDFIISKDAMDKLQEMVDTMHTKNSLFSTDELLNQVLMGMI